jgi:hypothetical protein
VSIDNNQGAASRLLHSAARLREVGVGRTPLRRLRHELPGPS